jgi:hypothetical protein
MIKSKRGNRIAMAEGFGPVYDRSGKIKPGFEGLGPTYMKDLGPGKVMPKTPTTPQPQKRCKIKLNHRLYRRPGEKTYFV